MTTAIEKYGHYIGTDHSLAAIESIQDTYTYHAKDFVDWCRSQDRDVNEDTVRDYFVYLNQSDYAAGTKRIKRQAVKKRIRQLLQDAPIDDQVRLDRILANLDTFGETRAPKINSTAIGQNKVINEEERMILLAATSKRLGLMMEFLWMTGCRVSEMVTARVGACTREGDTVDIAVVGKGNKERHIIIKLSLYDKIRDFYRGEEYLFETQTGKQYRRAYVSDQIHKLGLRVLRRSISAHSYRHSFATRKIKATGNLKGVSVYLGHSSTAITANMYDHNLLGDADLLEDEKVEI